VHHHFVQRWNGALDHQLENGHWPSLERANNLEFPSKLSPPSAQGSAVVQVQRSVRPHSKGGYSDSTPTVVPESFSGATLNIRDGEQSIYEQYKLGMHSIPPTQHSRVCGDELYAANVSSVRCGEEEHLH
jgi:hypothetical protein